MTTGTWTEAKHNSYRLDIPFGEIASNWATRLPKRDGINAALTNRSRILLKVVYPLVPVALETLDEIDLTIIDG